MAERIARIIGLDICGIDIMASDLRTPLFENGGAILEVNAAPGFRMHVEPSSGIARNVAEPLVDMLYPKGTNGRIPIIAVTRFVFFSNFLFIGKSSMASKTEKAIGTKISFPIKIKKPQAILQNNTR
jgi:hypothetical protein